MGGARPVTRKRTATSMDMSNLAVQYESDSYLEPSAPTREHLPAPAPLAMPIQSLGADAAVATSTPTSGPSDIAKRRAILATGTLVLTALACWTPIRLYAAEGFMLLEVIGLTLFMTLIAAISCWFTNAAIGLAVLLRGANDELAFAARAPLPRTRTALRHGHEHFPRHGAQRRVDALAGVIDRLQHDQHHFGSGGRLDLARAGFDEIGPGFHREIARQPHPVKGAELPGLQNHFQMRPATCFLYLHNFVRHTAIVAPQKITTRNHHIDLIRALTHRITRVFQLHLERVHPAWEGCGDRGDFHRGALESLPRDADHGRIHTDRCHQG